MMDMGDRVRSFDFAVPGKPWGRDLEGERACYVEGIFYGEIEKDGCRCAEILVLKDVFGGKERTDGRIGEYVYPPMNGVACGFSNDVCDFIEVIDVFKF